MSQLIKKIEKYVKKQMSQELVHGFNHADRVRKWALFFAKSEGFSNLEIVEVAALLHDVGYPLCNKKSLHGEIGAKIVKKYLKKNSSYSANEISEICNAIHFHNSNRRGKGKLLHILRDADMMDMFGPVGIMRAFISKSDFAKYDPKNIKGETWGFTAKHFNQKFDNEEGIGKYIIDHINFQISCYDNLKLEIARKIAKPLVEYMKDFVLNLEKQINKNNTI